MTVTGRPPLSRQRIADAALAYIDEHGLGALSMRKLGATLDVEAMSLYNHVDNKVDLLRAVTSTLYGEVLEAYGEPDGDWKTHARALSQAYVDVASRHPRALLLLIEMPIGSEHEMEFYARILAASRLMTDDTHAAALAFSVVGNWVIGTLVSRYGLLPRPDDVEPGPVADAGDRSERFSDVARFREQTGELTEDEKFAEGLETILAGVEARYFGAGSPGQISAGP